MNRYAIENPYGIQERNIAWYGIIIACSMVLGFAVAIYCLIFEWDNNKNDLLSVLVVNPGGLAIYGGVLGGVVVALIYRKEKQISPLDRKSVV